MKKKLLCLFLALVMMLSMVAVLSSCGDDTPDEGKDECTDHVDNNADGKCDECGKVLQTACNHADADGDGKCDKCGKAMAEGKVDYDWETTELIFQMTINDNLQELPAGCERYLAGEDINAVDSIDGDIAERNADAYLTTNVTLKYQYYPNTKEYTWSNCIEKMHATVNSGTTKGAPDIYCNFTYDIVGASLKGAFANLYSTNYGDGSNFFEFRDEDYDELVDNRGYMYDYMTSTTLSKHKMYVLASDYFTDIIRAFFIVPVNVALLESVGMEVTGDLDESGDFTIDDFYTEVKDKKWTYNKVAAYSEKVYKNTSGQATINMDDVVGFALEAGGLSGSGILYTTSVTIIKKEWDTELNDWNYNFPQDNEDLYTMCDNLSDLVHKTGFLVVSGNYSQYGQTALQAIRARFCDNKILFGGVMLVGSLEYDAYQKLKDASGFGVVPVPLYHEIDEGSDETYLTSIHNVGRPGAIAANTDEFAQCTAFLNYQSTHSSDILNTYYDYKLQYDIADGSKGTVEMLQYIRLNVRSAFDKTFEDAIGVFYETGNDRWHSILLANKYDVDIRTKYSELYQSKESNLQNLIKQYDELPG